MDRFRISSRYTAQPSSCPANPVAARSMPVFMRCLPGAAVLASFAIGSWMSCAAGLGSPLQDPDPAVSGSVAPAGADFQAAGLPGQAAGPDRVAAEAEFAAAREDLRKALREAARVRTELAYSGLESGESLRTQWIEAIHACNPARARFEDAAIALFATLESPDPDQLQLMLQITEQAFQSRQMARANRAARLLDRCFARGGAEYVTKADRDYLAVILGMSGLFLNDVGPAREFLKQNQALVRDMDDMERDIADQIDLLAAAVEDEASRPAPAEPRPLVRLATELGDIEIELFEDEAPRTVTNFIALIERGLYDETTFHAVFAGSRVQGGVFGTDGKPRFSGLLIADECQVPQARHHLYGTLSMALMNDTPNTASTQFMILLRPDCYLDRRQTAFGRVVRGMETAERIEPTLKLDEKSEEPKVVEIEGARPTRLLRAEILRKRDHEYRLPELPAALPGGTPGQLLEKRPGS